MSDKRKSVLPFIRDILDSIEKIEKYCQSMTYDQFLDDDKTRDAVVRIMEIIGEATKNIPDSVKERFPDIAWRPNNRHERQTDPWVFWSKLFNCLAYH